jgi:hypothetical protein
MVCRDDQVDSHVTTPSIRFDIVPPGGAKHKARHPNALVGTFAMTFNTATCGRRSD